MPNHWHMAVWPREADDLRRFVHSLTIRHSHRWHVRKGTVGRGALYQGRYKSCIIQNDGHLLTVCRYVERNPLRARLVDSAIAWPWSSAPQRAIELGLEDAVRAMALPSVPRVPLTPLAVQLPDDWLRWLDEPHTAAELERLRQHVQTGSPYGDSKWIESMGQRKAEMAIGEVERGVLDLAGAARNAVTLGAPGNGTSKRYK
jgi:putative transposase